MTGRASNISYFYDNLSFLWSINLKLGRCIGHIKPQVGVDFGVNRTVKFQTAAILQFFIFQF